MQSQICQRLLTRGDYVSFAMLVIPQLRGNPQLIAPDASKDVLQGETDLALVSVDGRTIEVPISDYSGALDCGCDLGSGDVV